MAIDIEKYATSLPIDANTAAGTVITQTNSGQRKQISELSFTNTSTSAAVLISYYLLDTSDLPIDTTQFTDSRTIQPGATWHPLRTPIYLAPQQSFVALPYAVDSVVICNCGGHTQS